MRNRRYLEHLVRRVFDYVSGAVRRIVNEAECPASFQRVISRLLANQRYDVYFSNYLKVTPARLGRFKGLKVVDLHDIQTNRVRNDIAPNLPPAPAQRLLERFERSERRAMALYDILIAISSVEQSQLDGWFHDAPQVELLPITFDGVRRGSGGSYRENHSHGTASSLAPSRMRMCVLSCGF